MVLPTTSCKLYRFLMAILCCSPAGVVVADSPDNSVNNAPTVTAIKLVSTKLYLPLVNTAIEITNEVVAPCIAAPCPSFDSQRWQGMKNDEGILTFPTALIRQGAIAYAHVVGESLAADGHGDGKKDATGLPIGVLKQSVKNSK